MALSFFSFFYFIVSCGTLDSFKQSQQELDVKFKFSTLSSKAKRLPVRHNSSFQNFLKIFGKKY